MSRAFSQTKQSIEKQQLHLIMIKCVQNYNIMQNIYVYEIDK